MINALTKGLAKMFGSKSDRDIKNIMPLVGQINQEFAQLVSISDDELRDKSEQLRQQINEGLADIDKEIAELNQRVQDQPKMDMQEKEEVFARIDQLEENRNERLEEILMDVLPLAFAVVKETARRFKENKQLVVSATMHDKQLAAKYPNITIEGEQATWHHEWDAAGTPITWDMMHYDVQL
ncbi:MAG: preprotein translocase subunit SecA, partial [Cyclobacteriaceae bacterium]